MFIFQYQQYVFLEEMNKKFGELELTGIEHEYIRNCILLSFMEFQRFLSFDSFKHALSFFSYSCILKEDQQIPGKRFACGSIYGMKLLRSSLLQVLQSRNITSIVSKEQCNLDYVGIGWEQTDIQRTFRIYMKYHNYNDLTDQWKLDKNFHKEKEFIQEGLIAFTYSDNDNQLIEYKLYRYQPNGEAWLFSSIRPEPIYQKNHRNTLPKNIKNLPIVKEMEELGYEVDTWAEEGNRLKIYWPRMPIWKLF
jgi:hypothetical protein